VDGAEPFRDRFEAGRVLAAGLEDRSAPGGVVLGVPRGGVPVAYEVARTLELPLDVFVVRKLGLPGQPELAMGAVASGGTRVLNDEVLRTARVSEAALERVVAEELAELERRERLYRGERPPLELRDRAAILVDDGLATGSSMLAAIHAVRRLGARSVTVAVPVAPPETCVALAPEADDLVCPRTPQPFFSVGTWYENFTQVSDAEVRELLDRASAPRA
jgi:putative phosphoribosyl transferase